jgi:hypothetical protein
VDGHSRPNETLAPRVTHSLTAAPPAPRLTVLAFIIPLT